MKTESEGKLIAPGKWYTEHDSNGIPVKAVYDKSYRVAFGYESEEEYNDARKKWANRIHPDDAERVESHFQDVISRHPEGMDYDIEYRIMTKWGYRWFHDYAHCIRREDGTISHCDGVIFDIQDIKDFELQQAHSSLQKEIMDYIVSHEDSNPIDMLALYAERIRELLDCDQIVYRDLEETRIMVNSSGIEREWCVPESYCRQCRHFNAFDPLYKEGYTEMDNCREGWQGVPVYEECPLKSALTRLVYCNGKIAGYLAIHYVQNQHNFTEIERKATEEFVKCFSLALSKYESWKQLQEVEEKKEINARIIADNYASVLALEDNLESLYDVELESGRYSEYVKGDFYQENVADKLLPKGDYFQDLRGNIDAVIYPEDRDELFNVLDRDSIRKALSENDRIEHFYRTFIGGVPRWFKIRVVFKDNEKKNVIIGCFDAAEEVAKKQMEEQRRQVLISQMAGTDGVFIVDCVHDTRTVLHDSRRGISESFEQSNYSDFIARHIMANTAESDRKMMLEMSSPAYMLERIKTESEFSVQFRDVLTGRPQFIEMKITKLSDTEVLQTFSPKDREVISGLISSSIEQDYFALYGVDLDFGQIQIIKDSPYFPQGGVGTMDEYSQSMSRFASYFEGETKEFFQRISDIGFLKRRFKAENKSTYTYQASTGQWVNVTGLVLSRHEDGTPSMFAVGFNFSDSMESKVRETQKQLAAQNERLAQASLRNDLLYEYANASWWSYTVNDKDEVISAKYGDLKSMGLKSDNFSDSPMAFMDCIHPEDRELVINSFMSAVNDHSNNTGCDTTYRILFANGEYNWVKSTGRILSHDDGTRELLGVCINISDTVKEQQSRLLGAVPLSPDILTKANIGMWAFELDEGKPPRMYDDETMLKLVGLDHQVPPEEAYHAWYDNIDKDSYELVNDAVAKMVAGEHAEVQYPWHFPDGRTIIVRCGGVRNPEYTKGIRIEGTHQDVTETLHYDEEHKKIERMKQSLNMFFTLSSEFDPIIVVEPESGEYDWYMSMADDVTANTSMTTHGDNLYKNIGIDGSSIIHEHDRAQFQAFYTKENMMKIARTGETQEIENRWYIQTEGRYKWKYNKAVRMVDESGKAYVVIGVMDTTDAKAMAAEQAREKEVAHRQLEAALKKAEVASQAKSSFLFNMSHDIRTPMNAITGFTTMAKKYADEPEKVKDYLDKIDVSGQQLLMLINQVLEMSRIESGKVEFDERPVNIKERYDTMVTVLAGQAASHGIEFHSSLQDIEHVNVLADDTRMSQVTLNIVGNAIKYTPEGGRIDFALKEIPARKEGRATFVFTVADTGIGMSEEFMKSLFEPFAREKTSTVSKIQGTGLGMSIVKSLVDLAGGNIDVKSESGKGSRFDITLDFRIDTEANPSKPCQLEERNLSFTFNGKRALLVEDNEMNREIAKFILEDKGVEIETADDGDVAVGIIGKIAEEGKLGHFDFILMDVQMPRMNGYEATKRIRRILDPLGVHIPIVALSANAFEEDRQKSIEAGMDDHVAKPIDINKLWETLSKYI